MVFKAKAKATELGDALRSLGLILTQKEVSDIKDYGIHPYSISIMEKCVSINIFNVGMCKCYIHWFDF